MSKYYVIKNKSNGYYFRGKGSNAWGKYYNQSSIYRIKGMAEHICKEISYHKDIPLEVVEIQIKETKGEEE